MKGDEAGGPTRLACLTPPGAAAIATLALCGPRAWEVVRQLFTPLSASGRGLPDEPAPGRFWLGRLGEAGRGEDEVVVAVKRGPPVPWVELHCHGGREVIRFLLEILEARGLEVCSWLDLERQGGAGPERVAALAALVEARTPRTAAILLDQYHGAFVRALAAVRERLTAGQLAEAESGLRDLLRYAGVGRHLTNPWRVVVAGAPNVGKSSLVNTLAGYQRSVVAATPGTTRDVVTTLIAVEGWPVELADTAGLRAGADSLEHLGIERARDAVSQADLCLWVLDASAPPVWPAPDIPGVRFVINKVDLPAAWDQDQAAGAVRVSALRASGLEELCRGLAGWLVPEPPPSGAAVPFTAVLCERVAAALQSLVAGRVEEAARRLAHVWGE